MTASASNFLTQYAQQAKAIPRTNPDWQSDLLYRSSYGDSATLTVSGGTNYVSCNAVQGARAFSADDLK